MQVKVLCTIGKALFLLTQRLIWVAGAYIAVYGKCTLFSNHDQPPLVGFSKKLRNLSAFDTDGQEVLIDAFSHCFPSAVQLRCFIHFKRNVSEKLKYGIPTKVAE